MKVTTEKLPKSLLALEIELDHEQVEKGLDRAARRFSQKYTIPGFRKGKAPRFIIENYFGREALIEDASEDLVNAAFRKALEQEQINPIGPASLENVISTDPFRFRVRIPISPTVTLPDYRTIQEELVIEPVTDETVEHALTMLRDKHIVLKELEEPRPAQEGDQLTVKIESSVEGEPLEERAEGEEIPETTLVLEPGRLVDGLYEGLIGVNVAEIRTIAAQMPEDHGNEKIRGKIVSFAVEVVSIQERLLPDWEELPTLENFTGSLEELRAKTRADLEESSRQLAERTVLDTYVERLVAQTEFDIPDVMIYERAEDLLTDQGRQFERYGITLDQMLQYRGQTREQAIEVLLPEAESQVRTTLVLQEVVQQEGLAISEAEIAAEVQRMLEDYEEEERPNIERTLSGHLHSNIARIVLDRKLRDRLLEIAAGTAPALEEHSPATEHALEEPAADLEEPAADLEEPAASEAASSPQS